MLDKKIKKILGYKEYAFYFYFVLFYFFTNLKYRLLISSKIISLNISFISLFIRYQQ